MFFLSFHFSFLFLWGRPSPAQKGAEGKARLLKERRGTELEFFFCYMFSLFLSFFNFFKYVYFVTFFFLFPFIHFFLLFSFSLFRFFFSHQTRSSEFEIL